MKVISLLAGTIGIWASPAFAATPFDAYAGDYSVRSAECMLNGAPAPDCSFKSVRIFLDESSSPCVEETSGPLTAVRCLEAYDRHPGGGDVDRALFVNAPFQAIWVQELMTKSKTEGTSYLIYRSVDGTYKLQIDNTQRDLTGPQVVENRTQRKYVLAK